MDIEIDWASELGAEAFPATEILSVYIPNKDRNGKKIDPRPWITEAANIMTRIGDGATITPKHRGVFLKEDGNPQWEDTVIVYTYILAEKFLKELSNLREFLHRFGRETQQRYVGFTFVSPGTTVFCRISKYDQH